MTPTFQILQHEDKTILHVSGDLGIGNISLFKNELISLLTASDSVALSLSDLENLDVSAIQLIHAFSKMTRALGKKLTVTPPTNAELVQLIRNAGLYDVITNNFRLNNSPN